jgi:hypothetical protein
VDPFTQEVTQETEVEQGRLVCVCLGRVTAEVCVIGRFKPAARTPAVPGFPFRRGILDRGWKAAHYFLLFLV